MGKIKRLDFLDSKELLAHTSKVRRQMDEILERSIFESREQEIKAINKLVIETAEKMGCSVYDVCLTTFPEVKYKYPYLEQSRTDVICTVDATVELVPTLLNLGQGPGYWKKKYYALKEKMQQIIDSKDETDDSRDFV